jgi:beta-aspartyl-peptidase (threonine type)
MENYVIVVHGGAGPDSDSIKRNKEGIQRGLADAIQCGYDILEEGGSAINAVEAAVNSLENNPLFNAGKGSALNEKAEVQMCASIMDGETLNSGAVAMVKNVKNPVSLARAIMENTDHIYLGGEGALQYAEEIDIQLEPDSYFVTQQQYKEYAKKRKQKFRSVRETALEEIHNRAHGTVGAVALDMEGNVAAATSTGGTPNSVFGRIGDSSMIGVGTYANNKTCAVSATGDGEYLIRSCIGNSISCIMRYKNMSVDKALTHIIHKENKGIKGEIGAIAVDTEGNVGMDFNSERMHRAWKRKGKETVIKIYREQI